MGKSETSIMNNFEHAHPYRGSSNPSPIILIRCRPPCLCCARCNATSHYPTKVNAGFEDFVQGLRPTISYVSRFPSPVCTMSSRYGVHSTSIDQQDVLCLDKDDAVVEKSMNLPLPPSSLDGVGTYALLCLHMESEVVSTCVHVIRLDTSKDHG